MTKQPIFVASQLGSVHVFDKNSEVEEADVFFDHEEQVTYKDKENEEGLLGFAMHPNYKENGEFFLFYTTSDAEHTSVVSRFRVSKDDPNKADSTYEEELIRIPQPFWNHNGGTLAFGPDGYLYIALGDGGKGGDPLKNGQNLSTLNGSILRIDVDNKDEGKNYAIPKSNPFIKPKMQSLRFTLMDSEMSGVCHSTGSLVLSMPLTLAKNSGKKSTSSNAVGITDGIYVKEIILTLPNPVKKDLARVKI